MGGAATTLGRKTTSEVILAPRLRAALELIEGREDGVPTGTGFVVDTLFSARHVLEADSGFKGVIRRSILLGHDTDTTAAVAGGLAGLRFGVEGLPEDWMALLGAKEMVEAIFGRLVIGEAPNPQPQG